MDSHGLRHGYGEGGISDTDKFRGKDRGYGKRSPFISTTHLQVLALATLVLFITQTRHNMLRCIPPTLQDLPV
jgi:hypothetical protein